MGICVGLVTSFVAALAGCRGSGDDRSPAGSPTPGGAAPAGGPTSPGGPSLPLEFAGRVLEHQGPPAFAHGDFDEDGRDDFLLVTPSSLWALMGAQLLPAGQASLIHAADRTFRGLVVADFNGDGHLDYAHGEIDATGKCLSVAFGDGHGSFFGGSFIVGESDGVAAGHFSGVSGADLVLDGGAAILPNSGMRSFGARVPTGLPGGGAVAVADFDGDGHDDLAVATAGRVTVARGHGNGLFSPPIDTLGTPAAPTALWSGDFDGDGRADVAIGSVSSSGSSSFTTVTVLQSNGDGRFGAVLAAVSGESPGPGPVAAPADFDGDGRIDLAVGLWERIDVLAGRASAPMVLAASYRFATTFTNLFAGDLDADGRPDITSNQEGLLWLRNVTP